MNKVQVVGRVSSLSLSDNADDVLATTILNGCYVFRLRDKTQEEERISNDEMAALTSSTVETYSNDTILGDDPYLSGCLVKNREGEGYIALGTSNGELVTISRRTRARVSAYLQPEKGTIRTVGRIKGEDTSVLLCSDAVTEVVDVETGSCREQLKNLAARAVGAISLDHRTVAVANYDGKVLLFDLRHSAAPDCILSIPDQICCLAMCPTNGTVCAGTVGGRVFTLRCLEDTAVREEAFTTGTIRSPIRTLAVRGNMVAAGDVSGRLSLLNISPHPTPQPTMHWTAKSLFSPSPTLESEVLPLSQRDAENMQHANVASSQISSLSNWDNAEVTGVAMTKGSVWASFCVHGMSYSYLVELPMTLEQDSIPT